eukprot:13853815-Heterocapsa_arctica.AAC.1
MSSNLCRGPGGRAAALCAPLARPRSRRRRRSDARLSATVGRPFALGAARRPTGESSAGAA